MINECAKLKKTLYWEPRSADNLNQTCRLDNHPIRNMVSTTVCLTD